MRTITILSGENGIYLEMQNIKEFVDMDGLKRFVIELKDNTKIAAIKKLQNTEQSNIEIILEDDKKSKIDLPESLKKEKKVNYQTK